MLSLPVDFYMTECLFFFFHIGVYIKTSKMKMRVTKSFPFQDLQEKKRKKD